MTCIGLDTDQHGSLTRLRVLHLCRKLERVRRNNTVVVVARSNQSCGILHAVLDVVQGRILIDILELILIVARAVLNSPTPTDRKLVVAQHIEYTHCGQADSIEIRALHLASTHQQTTIRATCDSQLLRRGVTLSDQILGSRDEVIEYVLLVFEHTCFVPLLAILTATTQRHLSIDTALLHKHNVVGRERGCVADIETTITIEIYGILTVEFQILAMNEEHRYLRTVLRGEEHLRRGEQLGIVANLGLLVEGRLARAQVVNVARSGSGETIDRIEYRRILLLATKARHRTNRGQLDLADQLARHLILTHLVHCVLHICRNQHTTYGANRFEQHLRILGNHILQTCGAHQIDLRQTEIGRSVVGQHVCVVALNRYDRVVVSKTFEQSAELALALLAIEHLATRRTLRGVNKLPLAVAALLTREVTQGVLCVPIDQLISRLSVAQFVIIDLLELVLRRIDTLLGFVVCAVIEALTVGSPACARELHPLDLIRELIARCGLHHADLNPIRASRSHRVSHIFTILRECYGRQRHGTLVRESIGIEEDLALVRKRRLAIEHRLVLQTVVIEIVVPIAVTRGSTLLRVVPELSQALADLIAIGNLREVIEGHIVLCLDPLSGFGGVVVLQPAVGIGYLGAEIVIHNLTTLGSGIGFQFDGLTTTATAHHNCDG